MNWETELPKMKLFLSNENYDELLKYKKQYVLKDYEIKNTQRLAISPIFREVTIKMIDFNPTEHYLTLTFMIATDKSEEK